MIDTRYIETDALVCAMEKAETECKAKVRQLSKPERKRLQEALSRLDDWIMDVDNESWMVQEGGGE